MHWKTHTFLSHFCHQQSHALYHNDCIAGLYADNHIHELLAHTNTQKLHTAFHYALRSVAITAHDAVGQTSVVHTNAHGCAVFATNLQKRNQTVLYFLQFCLIFLVCILQMFELTSSIHIISRIDTYFLAIACSHFSHFGVEMHISHQRYVTASQTHSGIDFPHILRFTGSLGCQADIFSSRLRNPKNLLNRGFCIHGGSIGH